MASIGVGPSGTSNRFTDYVHDPESNLEHTLFRQYSTTQGRFLSPDPMVGVWTWGTAIDEPLPIRCWQPD